MSLTLRSAVATFGSEARAKLSNPAATGAPEDQLRAPLEFFTKDLAELCGLPRSVLAIVGESSLAELHVRPDYAITLRNALVGFIEVKAPGKGADPRKFKGRHDKEQWEKLQSLPNLIYTDGNEFGLCRNGQMVGTVVHLTGDIETSGAKLDAPATLLSIFEDFFHWEPIAPRDPRQLAEISARLCRLLREEVVEQLAMKSPALTALATDWRKLLFPDATDARFADGYAQAVTFGMLMARARDIKLGTGLEQVARQLGKTNSLIGSALRLLTDDAANQETLKTSLGTLVRVLDAVDWATISKGDPDAWLYFYENFLEVYDNDLRKQTGSYYTPPEVVGAMVRLVDEVLRSPKRFSLYGGLASPTVTIADPAIGTGTFLLGILRRIAETVEADEGPGAVSAAIRKAIDRMIGFEIQLGPFAVAQLRLLAELAELVGSAPAIPLRMFVTDTLSNPYVEQEWFPAMLGQIAESRRQANEIKKLEPITVVIGNPPYKEKAMGRGGWVEAGSENSPEPPPLDAWMPPAEWGVSAHSKHLRNLYVYFWRWATWKAFDHDPKNNTGIVCFITVAGFLGGPGFQKMRDYLRRTTDEIWVIDCSPEGHQPEVNTRIFEGVQQPVCIVLASKSQKAKTAVPATVWYRTLPKGHRRDKLKALESLTLGADGWIKCPSDWREPFLPKSTGAWSTYPSLEDLFVYDGSGAQPGRTWVIAPDIESLKQRWKTLVDAPNDQKEVLFHSGLLNGEPGSKRVVAKGLPGYEARPTPVANDRGPCIGPVRYGFRSFDRQWILPDNRLINRPNPELWASHSEHQVYLSALSRTSPSSGPALTFTGLIPDYDHYRGSFGGRVFPLWRDREAGVANIAPNLLAYLGQKYGRSVSAEDLVAYIAAVATHPGFTANFLPDMIQPGLRIPITIDAKAFCAAVDLGRTVIWLHTFGERFADPERGRPASPPRLLAGEAPRITVGGSIPQSPTEMPDSIDYDPASRRLLIGSGYIENVDQRVWNYEVSGKHVLKHWFSYRKKNRERPIIGDRRPPSKLGEIQPDHWLAEYTTELMNVIHVLGRLVKLEPAQAEMLDQICSTDTISVDELRKAGALEVPAPLKRSAGAGESKQLSLIG